METILSAKASALCFNKEDFMVNDFSVDKFVSNYRKYVSLETLLADLGIYHRILCSAMVELINKDYADFLNLSSNLVGLDKSITILCAPLEKLEISINDNCRNLNETKTHASNLLHRYKVAHKKKILAHHALCVLQGLDKLVTLNSVNIDISEKTEVLDLLERKALVLNVVQFHMKKASRLRNIENKKGIIKEVAESLKNHLTKLFRQSLSKNDVKSLLRVLRIFAVISMEAEVEKIYAEIFVKPYMEQHVTEANILRFGLPYVYDKIFYFIKESTSVFNALTSDKKSDDIVPGYDFLVNSIFPAIVCYFDYITPVLIYCHGNPEQFHKNYTATMHFLDEVENFCKVKTSVEKLRSHDAYEVFVKKWNLDVYFQLIFSDVGGKFEKSILEGFVYPKDLKLVEKDKKSYLLNISKTLSECVNLCYNEKIFLKKLSHYFFRLNLQLISRFYKSTCSYLKCDMDESITPLDAAVIVRDVELLISEFTKLYEEKIVYCFPRNIAEAAFQESMKMLGSLIPKANSVIVKGLVKQCCVHLKLISDIPRLYRKTNREVPSKHSSYVSMVFNNLTGFMSETESILPVKSKKNCLEEVTNEIILQCVTMVRDVLTAIEKMEHSLKILKRKGREKNPVGSSGITDDDKIRMQLNFDIVAVEENVRKLQLDIGKLKSFKELKELMHSTEKILPQNF